MTNDNTRKKASAVFFSVIMVLSMVAVGFAGFAGMASAEVTDIGDDPEADDVRIGDESFTQDVVIELDVDDGDADNVSINNDTINMEHVEITDVTATSSNESAATVEEVFFDDNFDGDHPINVSVSGEADDTVDITVSIELDTSDSSVAFDDGEYEVDADGITPQATNTFSLSETIGADYDRVITGGQTVFQGQQILINVEAVDDNDLDDLELRRVTDDNNVGGLASAPDVVEFNGQNHSAIDTTNRAANNYALTNASSGTSLNEANFSVRFEVVNQDLDFDFDEDEVENAGEVEIDADISSDVRNSYAVTFTAEDSDGDALSEEELEGIFNDSNNFNDITDTAVTGNNEVDAAAVHDLRGQAADGSGGYILFDGGFHLTGAEGTTTLNFTDVAADDYEFTASVFDSTASDTDSIEVSDVADGELDLEEDIVNQEQGDVAEITVELSGDADGGVLVIGDEDDVGYQANVTFDADGEDEVTFLFNTYTAGNDTFDDPVTIANADDSDATITDFEQNEISSGDAILDVGDYGIAVSATGDAADALDDPDTLGTLVIEDRETVDQVIWTASDSLIEDILDEDEDEDRLAALVDRVGENVTQTDTIAEGDHVIHQIEASGLSGLLATDDFGNIVNAGSGGVDDDASLNLRVRQTAATTGANEDRNRLETAILSEATVLEDEETDNLYLIYDLDDTEAEDGEAYDARFRVQDERLLDIDEDDRDELTNTELRN